MQGYVVFCWQAQAKNVIKVNYVTNVIMVEEEEKKYYCII